MKILDTLLGRGTPGRDEFAELVLKDLHHAGFANTIYDPATFTIEIGGRDNIIFLDNAYTNYCKANKQERAAIVARLSSGWRVRPEIPMKFASARSHLMPVIRDASYSSIVRLDLMSKNVDVSKFACPATPLFGSVEVGLAYDSLHSIHQINQDAFDKWGVTFEEAIEEAKDNLRKRTNPKSISEEAAGLYRSQWGDSYDSARILLTDLIYRLSVYGDPVAFVPNRDQLWITGSRNDAALRALLRVGEEAHFQPYPISPDLFVLLDGRWQTYAPQETDLIELSTSLRRRRAGVDYAQQKQALDLIHASAGTDIFVATYMLVEEKDGRRYSACVWSKGVEALLPKSEYIYFMVDQDKKEYFSAPWNRAFSVVRGLMHEEPDLMPKRYRIRSFPSEEQLTELRQAE